MINTDIALYIIIATIPLLLVVLIINSRCLNKYIVLCVNVMWFVLTVLLILNAASYVKDYNHLNLSKPDLFAACNGMGTSIRDNFEERSGNKLDPIPEDLNSKNKELFVLLDTFNYLSENVRAVETGKIVLKDYMGNALTYEDGALYTPMGGRVVPDNFDWNDVNSLKYVASITLLKESMSIIVQYITESDFNKLKYGVLTDTEIKTIVDDSYNRLYKELKNDLKRLMLSSVVVASAYTVLFLITSWIRVREYENK